MSQAHVNPRHPGRAGWQEAETARLFNAVQEANASGMPLRSVFESLAGDLGRKPNSIRNFYYAQIREGQDDAQKTLPFETFSQEEINQLIRSVLTARAQGMSVRACVRKLSGGDKTLMLRYQNKYRSTVRARPELVRKVMDDLAREGIPFVSPYAAEETPAPDMLERMHRQAEHSGDMQLVQLFSSLDHLLQLALDAKETAPAGDAQLKADRLSAQCDMLRICLDDEQTRWQTLARETGGMVTLVKEYIALPAAQRSAGADFFCQQAAQRLSAVECALMMENTFPAP